MLLCRICLLLLCFSQLTAAIKFSTSAKAAILINADTGAVLYEKDAHVQLSPASTTKTGSGLFVLKRLRQRLDESVTISADAISCVPVHERRAKGPSYRQEIGGCHIGLKAGEVISVRDLLYGMMLSSANDASNALAEKVSGSVPAFMDELNRYLMEIGCLNTHFSNPHGLTFKDHLTTAYDLARMAQEGLKDPLYSEIVTTPFHRRPVTNKQPKEFIMHHNNHLVRSTKAHFYPKALGVKTGHTQAAGWCIVAAARDKGRTLIAVLLGCPTLESRYREIISLFETAFQEKPIRRVYFAKGYEHFSQKVSGGKEPVEAELAEDLGLTSFPSEEPRVRAKVHFHALHPPIEKGAVVGEMQLIDENGKKVAGAPLIAKKAVHPSILFFAQGFFRRVSTPRFILGGAGLLLLTLFLGYLVRKKRNPVIK